MSLEPDWLALRGFLLEVMDKNNLDDSSVEAVEHYISHSEYEMAFEGLFIELMESKCILTDKQKKMALDFGRQIELDHESVFSTTFWDDFLKYINL